MKILFVTNNQHFLRILKQKEQPVIYSQKAGCSYDVLKQIKKSDSHVVYLVDSVVTNIICDFRNPQSIFLVNKLRNILRTDKIFDYAQYSYKHAFLLKHVESSFCVVESAAKDLKCLVINI